MIATADLCDQFSDRLRVVDGIFSSFGKNAAFYGPITTVKVFEDNVLVRTTLSEPGERRVLVVDGGGSRRCALVGDQLAELAVTNGWAGVLVFGCIRDSAAMPNFDLGIAALGTHPMRSTRRGEG